LGGARVFSAVYLLFKTTKVILDVRTVLVVLDLGVFSLGEELGQVFQHELVNELVLHVSLYKTPSIVPDSPHSRKDRKLRVFNSCILLVPDLKDQLSKSDCCSSASNASTAMDNSFFCIILVCDQPHNIAVEHLPKIF